MADWQDYVGVRADHLGGKEVPVCRSSAVTPWGAQTPLERLPENVAFRCTYVRSWVILKRHWGLEMTCTEAQAIAHLLADYCP